MEMKSEKFQNIALGVLFVAVITLTIAYAAMSQQLNITASGTVTNKTASWNVHFTDMTCTESGKAEITTQPTTIATDITGLAFKIKAPGDSVTCTFGVQNEGLLNAVIANYSPLEGTCTDTTIANKLSYSIKYAAGDTDAGDTPAQGDTLTSGQTRNLVMTITYAQDATYLPENDVAISNINSHFTYEQATN